MALLEYDLLALAGNPPLHTSYANRCIFLVLRQHRQHINLAMNVNPSQFEAEAKTKGSFMLMSQECCQGRRGWLSYLAFT